MATNRERGKSIVIEGNDGTGKSTQVDLLAERLASDYGIESYVIHEPDGPAISAEIRKIIKNGSFDRQPITNLLLFMASRYEQNHIGEHQHVPEGHWLLKARDRSSSEAYQGYGEGLSPELIAHLHEMVMTPLYLTPDLKVILGLSDEERARRIAARGPIENPDTFEMRSQDFQDRVNDGYREIAKRDKLPYIDASKSIEEIHEEIMELIWLRGLLPRR